MKMRYLITLLAFLLCAVSINADPATTEKTSNKIAAGITIHNSIPSTIMGSLSLFSTDDLKSGTTQIWQRNKQEATSSYEVLPGIDLIVPCNNEHILTIYGEKTAVEKLKTKVATMDVTPKQVQIKVELVSLSTDDRKKLGIDNDTAGSISKPQIDKLKDSIAKGNVGLAQSLIISTVSGQPAELIITSDSNSYRLCALPIINTNGTITILSCLIVNNSSHSQEMSTYNTVANGETTLFSEYSDPSKTTNKILVLLTLTLID